jgi:hypothetical protein
VQHIDAGGSKNKGARTRSNVIRAGPRSLVTGPRFTTYTEYPDVP